MKPFTAAKPHPFHLTLCASAFLLCSAALHQAHAAVTTANATATVIAPIAITKVTDLAFGKFGAGTGGTVSVDTAGARTGSGVALPASGGTIGAASFTVSGEANATYAIDYSATSATLTKGADSMTLTLVSDMAGTGGSSGTVASGLLGAGGTQTLYVGGTLAVGASQAAGQYTGTISAAVAYN